MDIQAMIDKSYRFWERKEEQPLFKCGDLVYDNRSSSFGRLGVVCKVRPYYRTAHCKEETLYCVHHIDTDFSGKRMVCPVEGCLCCPICTWNAWVEEILPVSPNDKEFYVASGLIDSNP